MDSYSLYLPLGSIVKVKDLSTPVMIVQKHISPTLDYLGLDHPFGFVEEKEIREFNIDDIEEVYFIGYQNKVVQQQLAKDNIKKLIEGAKK